MLNILEVSKKAYSDEEKERFKKVIKVIVNLSVKVHSQGVLSLEEVYTSLEEKPVCNQCFSVESSIFQDKIMSIVDSQQMENIIMKAGYVKIALALKNCSSKVCEYVKNLSSEFINQQIKNTMDYIGPCRLKDLIDAQNFVLLFL